MNHYETVLIVTPVLTEAEATKMVKEYESYLKNQGAELVNKETWGLKQLAYPITNKTTGLYFLLEYKAPGSVIGQFEVGLQRDESVMRFLTVKLDKYGVEYAVTRRNKIANPEPAPEAETTEEEAVVEPVNEAS